VSTDWWSRKLGTAPSAPAPVQRVQPQPVRPFLQHPNRTPLQQHEEDEGRRVIHNSEDQEEAFKWGKRNWRGGQAVKIDGFAACPECGSYEYFSRRNASVGGMAPAPHCYSCGYNGRYEQAQQPAGPR
jgi:hypothetical protein